MAIETTPPRSASARRRRAHEIARVRVPIAHRGQRASRDQGRLAAGADPLQPRPAADRDLADPAVAVPVRPRHGPLAAGIGRAPTASTCGRSSIPASSCMAVMFTAMFSAASLVWDREFGFLREMMVAPVRRSSLVLGKCLGGATVAGFQGVIVLCLAPLVGVPYGAALIVEISRAAAPARLRDHRVRRDGRRADHARCSRSWR